ncbi:type I polyketide synthase [Actinacidiphila paucisporea]|uniref:Phthiocerol/phenolphthiocerol synthesis type-I polyketide synthase C n=1 Tax=Actinacidiphila paucisporea TaxID=310782 RepID=A0A1M7G8R6_9ACTN|nr:type I polyketide synthase [Actinacidiphila paucisporea]SHM12515.1 phthiocerol/phenolphthiocerol synthesis type-I polyketide synthase C [Actinacidiphila paucisporea]
MHADTAYDPEDLIAIVGMAGRFPGAPDTESLWTLLMESREAIVPVPAQRWDTGRPLDPDKDIQAVGGFVDGVENFDAAFFGVSPREAAAIDPQQRLMLEIGWRAMEDAGQRASDLAGTRTGVYVGASWHDYELLRINRGARPTPHSLVGNALDVIAARLSYFLQLRGPSLTVETGCSSSLVALHLAAQALRQGDVDAAIVGGVNLMMDPHVTVGLTHFGGLSPDGRSKAFSKHANGFVRGEGIAALYVKTLARALADGDRVHAVVARTVVNNDGGGDSLVTPSPAGQRDLLTRAYLAADHPVGVPSYIEAHGTGTGRGDPIEATAIGEILGGKRDGDDPLHIGSIKTNIGHLEACAGMAGLFKLLLSLRHRTVPPSLHAEELNPAIPFDELGLRVAREAVALPADGPVTVGVNSFGWGGTNAHVVLTSPPQTFAPALPAGRPAPLATGLPVVLPLSAKDRPVLALRARDLLGVLPQDAAGLAATAGALGRRRDHFPVRAALVADGHGELAAGLRAVAELTDTGTDPDVPGVVLGRAVPRRRVAFVFPGQGSQWRDMGLALHRDSPLFADVVARCAKALRPHCDWDLLDVFAGRAGDEWTTRIDMLQPTLWAMSLGLAELWRAAGVEPDVVLGHSQGEITAATVAGILSYEDAALVMARRSAIARRTSGQGRMLAVDLDREGALAALEGFEDSVSLAVHNGPTSCVLSGEEDSVLVLKELLEADGTYCRLVNVDYASHSPQMDPLREDLLAALEPVRPRAGATELMSTVRVTGLDGPEMDAAYWVENLRSPVLFADAMGALLADGVTHVVEISPHPVLAPAVEQIAAELPDSLAVLTTLRRDQGTTGHFALALARGYTRGLEPFATLPSDPAVPLPGYPLRADPYWPQERRGGAGAARGFDVPVTAVPGEDDTWQAALELSLADQPWLGDHRVYGTAVLPAAATLSVALDVIRTRTGALPARLEKITFDRGVTLSDDDLTHLTARWREDITSGGTFRLLSLTQDAAGWQPNATARGALGTAQGGTAPAFPAWGRDAADLAGPEAADVDTADFYRAWAARGLEYGTAFQGVTSLRLAHGREALGEVRLADRLVSGARPGTLHPALWDSALQVALALYDDTPAATALVPTAVHRVIPHAPLTDPVTAVWSHAVRHPDGRADVTLFATDHTPLLTMEGVELRPLDVGDGAGAAEAERLHRLVWTEVAADEAPVATGAAAAAGGDAAGADASAAAGSPAAGDGAVSAPAVSGSWAVRGDAGLARTLAGALAAAGGRITEAADADAVVFAVPAAEGGRGAQRAALDDLVALVPALADRTAPPSLTVVTVGAQPAVDGDLPDPGGALFWGFGRVLRREHPELTPRLVDIDGTDDEQAAGCVALLAAEDGEDQTALRGGRRFAARLSRGEGGDTLPPAHTAPQPFRFAPGGAAPVLPLTRRAPGEGEIEVEVTASALSGSCAGRVTATGPGVDGFAVGDRVAACGTGTPASHVTVPVTLARPIAAGLDDVAAAPLPLALATAGYALAHLGRLDAGESVLIHVTADDAAAQAAVRIATMLGARVLATAATGDIRGRLRDQGVADVFDSTDPAWTDQVAAATAGRGVDLMIGLPAGTAPDAGATALAPDGRLVVLGPVTPTRTPLPSSLTLASIDIPGLLARTPSRFVRALDSGWKLVAAGTFPPLPVTTHTFAESANVSLTEEATEPRAPQHDPTGTPPGPAPAAPPDDEGTRGSAAAAASGGRQAPREQDGTDAAAGGSAADTAAADGRTTLREQSGALGAGSALDGDGDGDGARASALGAADGADSAAGRSAAGTAAAAPGGRTALRERGGADVTVLVGPSTVEAVSAVALPDGRFRGDGTYLITGGLGELGLSLARFMADRGAGRLVLMGRSAPRAEAAGQLEELRALGAEVETVACDVADAAALTAALGGLRAAAFPLRGVVHAAGLLADSTIRNLTSAQLDEVLAPKVAGAANLDAATAGDPLDLFVLFSSAAALVGNAGQAAYAAGNAFMDALAQARRRRGRPGLSVQWGPFTGIGLAARDEQRGDRLAERGMGGFPADEAWPALVRMLERGDAVTGYVPIQLRQWFDAYPDTAALGSWRQLYAASRDNTASSGGEFLAGLLRSAPEARLAPAEDKVRELAGRIMRMDPARVESDTPFKALGLDSLMSLELRNRLEAAFGLKLSPTLLWAYGTPRALAGALCGQLPATDGTRPDATS